jgi:hypothetical protein
MLAAIGAVRQRGAGQVVCAVPVAAPSSLSKVSPKVDAAVCVITSTNFFAVGHWSPPADLNEIRQRHRGGRSAAGTNPSGQPSARVPDPAFGRPRRPPTSGGQEGA